MPLRFRSLVGLIPEPQMFVSHNISTIHGFPTSRRLGLLMEGGRRHTFELRTHDVSPFLTVGLLARS